jgi:predicted transcriptional regulator
MKNRGRFEVIAAILKAVGKEETRTKIMYRAMLGNVQCKLYLDSLVKSGLVHEVKSGDKVLYKVTPKAVRYLSHYNRMKELLPVGSDEALASIIA